MPPTSLALIRRWFFRDCGVGLGSLALAELLRGNARAAAPLADPLVPKVPHHAPRAKRVIFLFMAGAPSHLELFDNKPELAKYNGTLPPAKLLEGYRAAFINPNSKLLGPKFKFAKYGKCGAELSALLPQLATIADDLTIVKSMATDAFNHAPAKIFMSTGSQQFGRPSFGAWVRHGLGRRPRTCPASCLQSGKKGLRRQFQLGQRLPPTVYQGVPFRSSGDPCSISPTRPASTMPPSATRSMPSRT